MFLVFVEILLIVLGCYISIDYVFDNKISYAISDYIENIYNKLFNKKQADLDQISNTDKKNEVSFQLVYSKEYSDTNPNKNYYDKASLELAMKHPNTKSISFNVSIPFNTTVNILDMLGLDNCRWIVDRIFGLSIRGQKVDISNFCTVGATRTIVFLIGDNNFILSINFDSGETIIKTNSKEFESEYVILTFGAECIETPKNYYGKALIENSIKAKAILEEESENNKIGEGDDNV